MTLKVTLTQDQRDTLDAQVLERIRSGTKRQEDIASELYGWMMEELYGWMMERLPGRPDRFRYVDAAIQRLAKAKRIIKIGGGHYGWKVNPRKR